MYHHYHRKCRCISNVGVLPADGLKCRCLPIWKMSGRLHNVSLAYTANPLSTEDNKGIPAMGLLWTFFERRNHVTNNANTHVHYKKRFFAFNPINHINGLALTLLRDSLLVLVWQTSKIIVTYWVRSGKPFGIIILGLISLYVNVSCGFSPWRLIFQIKTATYVCWIPIF